MDRRGSRPLAAALGAVAAAPARRRAQPLRRSRRCPPRRSICASQPSSSRPSRPTASGAARRRRSVGRCSSSKSLGVLAAGLPDDARDLGDGQLARGGDVEVLVQAGGRAHRGDDAVGDVVDVGERARLLARAEDLQRALPGEHLVDQVGHRVRDARLGVGHLARAVGVEGAADRVGQAVLVVRGAAVDLAGELREAVGGRAARGSRAGSPRASGTARRARRPSRRTRTRSARPRARAPRG